MSNHHVSKQIKVCPSSLRAACSAVVIACAVILSACAVTSEDAELRDEVSQLAPDHCDLAVEQYQGDELPYLSCQLQQPVDAEGLTPGDIDKQPAGDSEIIEKACYTYYGTCTGANGCSRAEGWGWEYTECGAWLYAWMTVCDGQPSSWGTGFCLF